MSAETQRLFIAISVPDEVKAEIENAQHQLKRALPSGSVRWVRREQFHLTLKFLGEVASNRFDELSEVLQKCCREFPQIRLRAEGIGCFPNLESPRVIWAGVDGPTDGLAKLRREIESVAAGFTGEKSGEKFAGHLTLGRVKFLSRGQAALLAAKVSEMEDNFFGEWTAGTVRLFRSELGPGGARHCELAAVPLAGR